MSTAAALPKPLPPPAPKARPVQVVTRLSETSRRQIQALAEAEGITVQALGLYAWSLALQQYGRPPLREAEAAA
jgi:hypothetical protein